ncbi:MAG: glutathione S-transferase N-terminal domain-containing protein [Alphaproteobacteria bacterium]|jgi:GST-like protein|nr:glutathione S-transferase [Rhodospirillaceae bacterium]MDP6022347.1 glutathione S-transferase N-terminal domain-containing protein [Alphaproteobacteria bacterium]MDP6256422.1 glutathione S-transferase N-terminal domain-containing protein [Alphaproteobacteria bacterium]MDP7053141.1 glutathione S-transferase N-terminal domain-containing protein [Alphaproteobacteria bacterium]MDP7228126.1 glutathione S-transferase N-terminal domain-containing protein [Alphaproteobacteria bacterium]|tara:strand:+ start:888 stop:1505 length:618 start_codon:yes stop_codon:yes gene_type:complete
MIDLYSWKTSNGKKASIMLEECGLEYNVHPINIGQDDQFTPEFTAINPNGKIPAIIDQDGPGGQPYTVIESGAILMYLAEKTGQFMPAEMAARYDVIQWLMFQMGGIGPIFGQVHHFKRAAKEQVPYAINRYYTECRRLYSVLNGRLEGREYLAGDVSIADFATLPWVFRHDWQEVDLADFPNVKRWYDTLMARPALTRGMDIPV